MPMQRHSMYQQRGCIGCALCEGGGKKIARTLKVWCFAFFTGFVGLIVIPFYGRCVYCGHTMFFNRHQHGGN
jgi:hypothetical protein